MQSVQKWNCYGRCSHWQGSMNSRRCCTGWIFHQWYEYRIRKRRTIDATFINRYGEIIWASRLCDQAKRWPLFRPSIIFLMETPMIVLLDRIILSYFPNRILSIMLKTIHRPFIAVGLFAKASSVTSTPYRLDTVFWYNCEQSYVSLLFNQSVSARRNRSSSSRLVSFRNSIVRNRSSSSLMQVPKYEKFPWNRPRTKLLCNRSFI